MPAMTAYAVRNTTAFRQIVFVRFAKTDKGSVEKIIILRP